MNSKPAPVISEVGNIVIVHREERNSIFGDPNADEWDDEMDLKEMDKYIAELERKIRLRPANFLRALEKGANFGVPADAELKGGQVSKKGEVCTIECFGLCGVLRELRERHEKREKRALITRRLQRTKKTTKDASA